MPIKVVKLTSGEEIIGDVSETSDNITVKNPCYLQMVPSRTDPNMPAMALVPSSLHLEDKSFTVSKTHVIYNHNPVKDLYNQYNSVFGSGIQLSI